MPLSLKQCYRADGRTSKDDVPCDPNAEVSTCCGPDSGCVQNLYCRNSGGLSIPGTCTDQNWGISNTRNPACPCPPHYKDDNTTLNYFDSVTICPDGSVCCGIKNFACCNAGQGNPIISYSNPNDIPKKNDTSALEVYYAALRVSTLPVSGSRATATANSSDGAIVVPAASGMSAGTKAAITVAIAVATAVCLVALVFMVVMWRRYVALKTKVLSPSQSPTVEVAIQRRDPGPFEMSTNEMEHPALREKRNIAKEESEMRNGRDKWTMRMIWSWRPIELDASSKK